MESTQQVYHLKVDASGRILLPAEARERNHIAGGDTLVFFEDASGLHIKTHDQLIAEAQAHFAKFAPPGVLLSEEVLADRRTDIERD